MTTNGVDFQAAQRAFNNLDLLRGQYTNIATADENGTPNVAPVGSMRLVDAHTVHVAQAELPKTVANLKKNPRATFSVSLRPTVSDFFNMFRDSDDQVMGYRVYCTWTGASDDRAALDAEVAALRARVPFFMRRGFQRFCDKMLKRVLTFTVDDIRVIG